MSQNIISPRKRKAIVALLSEKDIRSAAAKVSVNERTIYRWMADPDFQAELLKAEGDMIDAATRHLVQLQQPAIETIKTILNCEDVSPNTRLRAAQTILDYLIKLRELRNLENRLATLEETINEYEKAKTKKA
jgi:hypothetical protein